MIKVIIEKKDNFISKIIISGHAFSNKHGKDLVCAGVSASSIGVLNALEAHGFLENQMGMLEMNDGYIKIEVFESNNVIEVILETLIITLDTIEEDNKKYIKISKVEV